MLNFSFNLYEVYKEKRCSSFLNVFENLHNFSKKRYLNEKTIPIAHISNDASKTSEKLLTISHVETGDYIIHSSKKIFNYAGNEQYKFIQNNKAWHHTNVIVTGLFLSDEEPLWYGHRLSRFATNIEVFKDGVIVSPDKYLVVTEIDYLGVEIKKTICHSFDHSSGLAFVKYKINDRVFLELLNRGRLYNRSFDFIDNFYSPPNKSMLLYKVVKEKEGFRIVLPGEVGSIALKELEISIYGDLPKYQFSNEPWHLEVPLTEFYSDQTFEMQMFHDQYFYPSKPFKQIVKDVGIVEQNHLVRISHQEILTENIYLHFYLEDEDKPSLLLTNDSTKQDTLDLETQLVWNYSPLSVSSLDNLIYVPENISGYSFVKATYSIRSYSFIDERLNLNPFMNPEIKNKKVVYYYHPLHQIIYFVLDTENFVTEVSDSNYNSWIGKQYEIISPKTDNPFSFFFYLGDLLKTSLDQDKAVLLAQIHQPEYLEEYDNKIVSVNKLDLPSLETAFQKKPFLLPIVDNELHENIWSIPELKNTEVIRIHWTRLKDYISSNLFYKDNLKTQLNRFLSAGSQVLIIEEGSPRIECTEIDLENSRFKIEWIPPVQLEEIIEATIYTSTDNITFAASSTIENLVFKKYAWISLEDPVVYVKLKPRITRNGNTYFGPQSNVVCVTKEYI